MLISSKALDNRKWLTAEITDPGWVNPVWRNPNQAQNGVSYANSHILSCSFALPTAATHLFFISPLLSVAFSRCLFYSSSPPILSFLLCFPTPSPPPASFFLWRCRAMKRYWSVTVLSLSLGFTALLVLSSQWLNPWRLSFLLWWV